jgi:hypothetical protein
MRRRVLNFELNFIFLVREGNYLRFTDRLLIRLRIIRIKDPTKY